MGRCFSLTKKSRTQLFNRVCLNSCWASCLGYGIVGATQPNSCTSTLNEAKRSSKPEARIPNPTTACKKFKGLGLSFLRQTSQRSEPRWHEVICSAVDALKQPQIAGSFIPHSLKWCTRLQASLYMSKGQTPGQKVAHCEFDHIGLRFLAQETRAPCAGGC